MTIGWIKLRIDGGRGCKEFLNYYRLGLM